MVSAAESTTKNNLHAMREIVRAAFLGVSAHSSSPMADRITTKPPQLNLLRRTAKYPHAPMNTTVTAKETRRPGFSRPLIDRHRGAEILQRIKSMPEAYQITLRYFYDSRAGDWYGNRLKQILWQGMQDDIANIRTETRCNINYLIDLQLLIARGPAGFAVKVAKPWEFLGTKTRPIDRKAWYKTYNDHWERMRRDISMLDEKALYDLFDRDGK